MRTYFNKIDVQEKDYVRKIRCCPAPVFLVKKKPLILLT